MKSILATLFALMLASTVAQEPTAIDGGHSPTPLVECIENEGALRVGCGDNLDVHPGVLIGRE